MATMTAVFKILDKEKYDKSIGHIIGPAYINANEEGAGKDTGFIITAMSNEDEIYSLDLIQMICHDNDLFESEKLEWIQRVFDAMPDELEKIKAELEEE